MYKEPVLTPYDIHTYIYKSICQSANYVLCMHMVHAESNSLHHIIIFRYKYFNVYSHCGCRGMPITLVAATCDHAPGAAPQSTYI